MKMQQKRKPYFNVPCDAMSVNLADSGKFYELDDAINSIQTYFDQPDTPSSDDPKHLYAHTFGLNKLRELINNIDLYNSNLTDSDMQIQGVRVYYGLDKRDDPDFPLAENTLYRDLVFMPVFENGVDLYPIDGTIQDKIVNSNLILSRSRPCPPQCSTLSFINNV